MSCCAVVIDSHGNIICGYESGITDKKDFLHRPVKLKKIKTGETILSVGTVRSGEKFIIEYEKALGDISLIPKEEWWMDDKGEWEGEAIVIKPDGSCFDVDGPMGMYQLKSPGFYAIGSGGPYAFGVLWHLLSGKKRVSLSEARKALERAIESACALDDYCSKPIIIETLEL